MKGRVFFDGLCVLCSKEIEHYRAQQGSEAFEFLDITDPSFDAQKFGVDPYKVHAVMHVQDPTGQMHTGVDAFRAIWKQLPRYHFLFRFTQPDWVQRIMRVGYFGFATIRPWLPRRNRDLCADSPFCETHASTRSAKP